MKKGLEKFISILLLVLGGILIVFLSLAVFGQLDEATMANEVVRAMIIGLALVFFVAAIIMIVLSFKDSDVLKAVVLSSERASTTRVSLSVIRRIVSKNAKYISGLKVTGVTLSLDENNAIRMKLTVKISENDVDFVVDRFRCLLYDAFYAVLGVEFASIDFQVKALSPKYAPDMNKVDRAAAEIKEKREKLMLQKLKMEEEEARFEEERKREAEKRRKEEARLRREREDARRQEREVRERDRLGDLADAEEVPVYVIEDDFAMPEELAEETCEADRAPDKAETKPEEEASREEKPLENSVEETDAQEFPERADMELPKEDISEENAGSQSDSDKKFGRDRAGKASDRADSTEAEKQKDTPKEVSQTENAGNKRTDVARTGHSEVLKDADADATDSEANEVKATDPEAKGAKATDVGINDRDRESVETGEAIGREDSAPRTSEAASKAENLAVHAETLDAGDASEYIESVGSADSTEKEARVEKAALEKDADRNPGAADAEEAAAAADRENGEATNGNRSDSDRNEQL